MIINGYPDELDYVNALLHGQVRDKINSFLGTFCLACVRADSQNYELLRPLLLIFREKYPADPKRLAMERIDSGRERAGDRERVAE